MPLSDPRSSAASADQSGTLPEQDSFIASAGSYLEDFIETALSEFRTEGTAAAVYFVSTPAAPLDFADPQVLAVHPCLCLPCMPVCVARKQPPLLMSLQSRRCSRWCCNCLHCGPEALEHWSCVVDASALHMCVAPPAALEQGQRSARCSCVSHRWRRLSRQRVPGALEVWR